MLCLRVSKLGKLKKKLNYLGIKIQSYCTTVFEGYFGTRLLLDALATRRRQVLWKVLGRQPSPEILLEYCTALLKIVCQFLLPNDIAKSAVCGEERGGENRVCKVVGAAALRKEGKEGKV